MKRKLCGFLAVVMLLTSIIIPTSVGATEPLSVAASGTFSGDYFEGDTIIDSFDASYNT